MTEEESMTRGEKKTLEAEQRWAGNMNSMKQSAGDNFVLYCGYVSCRLPYVCALAPYWGVHCPSSLLCFISSIP